MMKARENRQAIQQKLLREHDSTLLVFTMNIPGDEKISPLIIEGFNAGNRLITDLFKRNRIQIIHSYSQVLFTGCESYYAVNADALQLKKQLTLIENQGRLGQLFDLDVIDHTGHKIDREEIGLGPRKCLICDQPAKLCGRSRNHSVTELQNKVNEILNEEICSFNSERIATAAQQGLLYELVTTPKPGLVDINDSGSHQDMDRFTFSASAASLYPYFYKAACLGFTSRGKNLKKAFESLRKLGKQAETTMFGTTKGINTHKGAIFTLGILCCCYGLINNDCWNDPSAVSDCCRQLTEGIVANDLGNINSASTHGESLYLNEGITGIRGEAEKGFPSVFETGLPVLQETLKECTYNQASLAALLAIISAITDTNIISRSDISAAEKVSQKAKQLFDQKAYLNEETMNQFNQEMVNDNLSPGGSADLLAASWMVYLLKEWKYV